ncbi:hypothetical protein [Hydrogenophaga sp. MI9]|uniref:hypothetical protein n=1 Tax=Hydrogenophaga sp. MI9 TaxID=3453719 RepID=UPI003EEEBF38
MHRLGYRFRLHRKDLPGRPDVVLPKHRKAILVHGCFWHGHGCKLAPGSKSNLGKWSPKIEANRARDACNMHCRILVGRSLSFGSARSGTSRRRKSGFGNS